MSKRKTQDIRIWLMRKGVQQTHIARDLGVGKTLVSETISGKRNNRRVLRALLELGVPERLLALPDDLKRKEAA